MEAKTARIDKWDNFKWILILLVVIGHLMKAHLDYSRTARVMYWFIYLFHMPAFIMVSGMFAKRSIREKRYDRAFMFLLLYFLIKFLMFVVRLILGERISMSLISSPGIEWYALALFVYYLLTMYTQKFERKQMVIMAVIFGCMAAYDSSLGDEYALARLIVFYPFFLSGYYLESDKVMAFTEKKIFKVIAAAVLLTAALISLFFVDEVYWTISLLKGNVPYRVIEREIRPFSMFFRVGQYVISMLLVLSVLAVVPSRKLPFSYIGRRTLPIYALHMAVIEIFYDGFSGAELLQSISGKYYEFLLIPIGFLIVLILSLKPFVALVNRSIMPRAITDNHVNKTQD